MRRSRTALTLFLGALAAALQTAGRADISTCSAKGPIVARQHRDCFARAPRALPVRTVAFAEDWYLDYGDDCYADCHQRPAQAAQEPVWHDAYPIEEYQYGHDWNCEYAGECDAYCDEYVSYLACPRVHLEDLSYLANDPRHSAGQNEVAQLNRENEGLQAASLSTGHHPHDLPCGETFYIARLATARTGTAFDDDDAYPTYSDCRYCDCYGSWHGSEVAGHCQDDEPADLPPAEAALHVAQQPGPVAYDEYADDYDYSSYHNDSDSYYAYDDYSQPYASRPVMTPPVSSAAATEDVGEFYDDYLPAEDTASDDLPPGEYIWDDLPPAEFTDDLPPAEPSTDDLPPGEYEGEDLPSHEVLSTDLPPAEDINDLPPAEAGHTSQIRYRNDYECDYDYQCDYGDYESYGQAATPVRADYSTQELNLGSLRPVLRTASWVLNEMGEALLGLSKSVDQLAEPGIKPVNDAVHSNPPEMDYPWPTIIGRQPNRDIHPGL